MPRSALILFAHGARDPRWADPFQAVARAVRERQPDLDVRLAFLEFMTPSLPEAGRDAVADGATRVDVVPLFLGAGGHVRKDLPMLMDTLRSDHPGAAFHLHPAVGEIASVVQAMADASLSLLKPHAGETAA